MITGAMNLRPEGGTAVLAAPSGPVRPKDDTFLNLLAQKRGDLDRPAPSEKEETPAGRESAEKAAPAQETKSAGEEGRRAERTKERLVSDLAGLIDRLKELALLLKLKGSQKKGEAVQEKLVLDIGAFFDRIKNLDIFKASSGDLKGIKANLKEQLKVKEFKDRDIFQKVMAFLKNLKQSLEQAADRTRAFRPMPTEMKPFSLESDPARESRLIARNRKTEVLKIKSEAGEKGPSPSSDRPNGMPGLKNLLLQKLHASEAADNPLHRLTENRAEEEAQTRRVDSRELMNRITEKIRITLNENKSEVVMNLKPEFLGKLTVKLEFRENTIAGKFIVDNVYAEKAVKDGLAQLKVAFQNMGMEVSHFDVSLTGGQNPSARQADFHASAGTDGFRTEKTDPVSAGESVAQVYDRAGWIAQNVNITV